MSGRHPTTHKKCGMDQESTMKARHHHKRKATGDKLAVHEPGIAARPEPLRTGSFPFKPPRRGWTLDLALYSPTRMLSTASVLLLVWGSAPRGAARDYTAHVNPTRSPCRGRLLLSLLLSLSSPQHAALTPSSVKIAILYDAFSTRKLLTDHWGIPRFR